MLVVCSPWHKPAVLRRVWCLHELNTAVETKTPVVCGVPPTQRAGFLGCLCLRTRSL